MRGNNTMLGCIPKKKSPWYKNAKNSIDIGKLNLVTWKNWIN